MKTISRTVEASNFSPPLSTDLPVRRLLVVAEVRHAFEGLVLKQRLWIQQIHDRDVKGNTFGAKLVVGR